MIKPVGDTSVPGLVEDVQRCLPCTPPRAPHQAPPLSDDEQLKSKAVDAGIDFSGKDAHWPDIRTRKSGLLDRATALAATSALPEFVQHLPKCEVHVHFEGTLTPQRAHELAARNGLANVGAFDPEKGAVARAGYVEGAEVIEFSPGENALNAFLTEYNRCSGVYREEQDFYDVMSDYLQRAAENGVQRAEIFFDPQTHCFTDVSGCAADPSTRDPKGIGAPKLPYEKVIGGLRRAMDDARQKLGVDSDLIMCFLMDRSTEEADAMLDLALQHKDTIIGVGIDNGTGPFGPGSTNRFAPVYAKAKAGGLHLMAHAGEEEGSSNVTMALDTLQCERIDHGIRSLEDPAVVERLVKQGTALTVCPISNHRMQIHSRFFCGECPVRPLLERGVKVTLNSDDPAYFFLGRVNASSRAIDNATYDGFIASNYLWAARTCGLTPDDMVIIARNSIEACFVPAEKKAKYLEALAAYCDGWQPRA